MISLPVYIASDVACRPALALAVSACARARQTHHDGLLDRSSAPVDAMIVPVRRLPGSRQRLLLGQAGQDALRGVSSACGCAADEDDRRARVELHAHEAVRDGVADVLRCQLSQYRVYMPRSASSSP